MCGVPAMHQAFGGRSRSISHYPIPASSPIPSVTSWSVFPERLTGAAGGWNGRRGPSIPPRVSRPADAPIVEIHELDGVELHDVEVRREVEIARRDERLALAVEEHGIVGFPAADPVHPA